MKGPKKLTVFLLMLSILLIAACSSGNGDTKKNSSVNDKQITIGLSAGVNTLDFHRTNSGPDFDITRQMTETLLTRDDNMEFQPGLATEWEMIDDLTYQFKLRDDVTFHNGEPFNAEAVKFSIERYFDDEIQSPHKDSIDFIDSVEVVDEFTVNVHLNEPSPLFLTRNSMSFTGTIVMVPPKYIEENGNDYYAENPVGTGPYKFKESIKGEKVVLEVYEDYWGEKPDVEEVVFRFIPEDSTRLSSLLAGDVDVIQRVPSDLIDKVETGDGTKTVISTNGGYAIMMQLNPDAHPALQDKRVREAMNYAVDIQTIIDTVLDGRAERLAIPADPLAFGFNPNIEPFEYNPEKAKELLAEAGYADGFSLEVNTSEGRYPGDRAIADSYAAQLAEVGINVDVRTMEWGSLVDAMIRKEAGPMYQIGWLYSEFDISKLYPALHPSSGYSTVENEEFANLLDEAERELDPEKREQLWWKAQEILIDEVPYIHSWQPHIIYGAKDNIDFELLGDLFFVADMKLK